MLVSHDFKGLATSFYTTSFILLGIKKKKKNKEKKSYSEKVKDNLLFKEICYCGTLQSR